MNYYIAAKNYDKAFEYGDKLFAIDPDNFANAVNMVRAAQEKGDSDKLLSYGAKAADILKRYKASSVPDEEKKRNLENAHDNIVYVQQLIFNGAYQTQDPAKRAAYLVQFAQMFPDSPYADQAMGVAAASYRQTQNTAKMLEVANGLLAKDPNNVGMLLLLGGLLQREGRAARQSRSRREEGDGGAGGRQKAGRRDGRAMAAAGFAAKGAGAELARPGQHPEEEQRGSGRKPEAGIAAPESPMQALTREINIGSDTRC